MAKKKKSIREELAQVAETLRDPFRMRSAVAIATVVIMFFAISEPLHGRVKREQRELTQLKAKVQTVEEMLLLQDRMEAVEPHVLRGESNDIVTGMLLDLVQSEQVDLIQINAEAPQSLGPMDTIGVNLNVAGDFASLHQLLHRIESQQYLVRIESLKISPSERSNSLPTMQLSIRVLRSDS
ncbi:GspMb/PilO family protein [Stieleria varia]|uniref:General secretion pathway protein M n=1 Tax=Stieleria varia TaxID=2528005 RepID=A0A5C6B9S9_9BACT|nr:GspMb/PilO family protein [Stieleria varia]TWU08191.1 General secretion pathway protein M [Stieleria varia]